MCNQRVQYYGQEVQKRQFIQIKNVDLASYAANLPRTHTYHELSTELQVME